MKVCKICIRNFRRLEDVSIEIEDRETVLVGPNNSGKTSATAIFRCFLGGKEFRLHDFSVSRVAEFEALLADEKSELPRIELDIWFSIDPNSIAYGRAVTLLPRLSDEFSSLGVRLSFGISDSKATRASYELAYPAGGDGARSKSLAQFLAIDANLKRNAEVAYFSLEAKDDGVHSTRLEKEEARNFLQNLLRVDFVDAQRNIDDEDSSRSNRLSSAFASFYRTNLQQPEAAAEAHQVIDANNAKLTEHYAKQFNPLFAIIKDLGVPSLNDRTLKIISSLSPDTALRGNTELLYVDTVRQHELPELYNGLGFKNLIYMAIQAGDFHSRWIRTEKNRPLCQLIFIEEPEVHLHAQVQQTFIRNVWSVIQKSATASGLSAMVPQLLVSTHSSHVLDAVDFAKVRYFRRCPASGDGVEPGILNASEVRSLRAFQPEPEVVEGISVSPAESLAFLKKYLRLTHCDLFFADGVILVEGSAEKLLLPAMMDKVTQGLGSTYVTTLEVGGAYAHRFEGLLAFLRLPYLVITDLDSVSAEGHHAACRADTPNALSSNATLKKFCGQDTVERLLQLTVVQKEHKSSDRFVAFQTPIEVEDGPEKTSLIPRTLEEAIVYQNFALLRSNDLSIGIAVPVGLEAAYAAIYERVRSTEFKKTDFAMSIMASKSDWKVPAYIVEGLRWLEKRLCRSLVVASESETAIVTAAVVASVSPL